MILLRHGQSAFNLHFTRTRQDPGIVDPPLTAAGLAQAEAAAERLCPDGAPGGRAGGGPDGDAAGGAEAITRIIVSPYRRALQTAAPLAARLGVVPAVSAAVRERYAFVCDIGSAPAALARDWPGLDFSGLDAVWWHDGRLEADGTPASEAEGSVIERADRFRRGMAADPEWRRTAVVSHWGFLLALSGCSIENGHALRFDPTVPPPPINWKH